MKFAQHLLLVSLAPHLHEDKTIQEALGYPRLTEACRLAMATNAVREHPELIKAWARNNAIGYSEHAKGRAALAITRYALLAENRAAQATMGHTTLAKARSRNASKGYSGTTKVNAREKRLDAQMKRSQRTKLTSIIQAIGFAHTRDIIFETWLLALNQQNRMVLQDGAPLVASVFRVTERQGLVRVEGIW